MVKINDGFGTSFEFSEALANHRTVELARIAGKDGSSKRGDLPTRATVRATFTSAHERGRIAFTFGAVESDRLNNEHARTLARRMNARIAERLS